MKKTIQEKIRYRLLRMGRKGPFRRILAIAGIYVFFALVHSVRYLQNNKKRLSMVMMSMVLFVAYASFSLPIFSDGEERKLDRELAALLSDDTVSLASEEEVRLEDMDSWEEEFDWEEEEYSLQDEEEEQLHLEDILNYRQEQEGNEDNLKTESAQGTDENTKFSLDDWRLILVNKQHPIPEDYDFTLATIKGSQRCDERIIDDLLTMMQAAKDAGFTLVIKSPYRSDARQEYLFDRKIKQFMGKGMSYMDAFKLSSQVVMVPDSSEHQIGLSLDIVCDYYETLTQGFGDTEAGKWMEEHCAEFGFIVRYPKGKEYITSVEYEPWHFRYVGVEAATIIMEQELTLEEFVEGLK
ncbi:MAG: M15 family metallopeptidase [bacterium]|nr:M15 family metallopeptidase [bacterium]